jgi:hypothetical protein
LFKDVVRITDYISSNDGIKNELERIWKEAVVEETEKAAKVQKRAVCFSIRVVQRLHTD